MPGGKYFASPPKTCECEAREHRASSRTGARFSLKHNGNALPPFCCFFLPSVWSDAVVAVLVEQNHCYFLEPLPRQHHQLRVLQSLNVHLRKEAVGQFAKWLFIVTLSGWHLLEKAHFLHHLSFQLKQPNSGLFKGMLEIYAARSMA